MNEDEDYLCKDGFVYVRRDVNPLKSFDLGN